MRVRLSRKASGSSIAEIPVALFVLLIVLLFPLLDLGTIALRSATIFEAARNAAHHAGRAKSFLQDGGEGELSAKSAAVKWTALTCHSSLRGTSIESSDVQATIIGTPFDTKKTPVRSASPLPGVEPETYLYQIEVSVTGSVEPLVLLNKDLLGQIPGVTAPLKISATFREFCEHPYGLTI
ncbi:MAG: hypothetical protein K2X77_01080 [Candidatus Obscuribacterales bacterium]|jgi:hypothetical protein|nr:hypothetical protein [Candidatus Obscuribacterales bacterium]